MVGLLAACRTLWVGAVMALGFHAVRPAEAARPMPISLDGEWQLSIDEGKSWRVVRVPATFEQQIDRKFDGVAWLRRTVELPARAPGQRLMLHFAGVATEAEVLVNGQSVGRHLGGWTPWRCDLTDIVERDQDGTNACELLIKVDEKVGHNTQGFLPIIAPHFGGLWQSVSLLVVPDSRMDDLRLLLWGDREKRVVRFEIPFSGTVGVTDDRLAVAIRRPGATNWSGEQSWRLAGSGAEPDRQAWQVRDHRVVTEVAWDDLVAGADPETKSAEPLAWSPQSPHRYQVRLRLVRDGSVHDECLTWLAFRHVAARGRQVVLNGQPLSLRGVLNWGYQQHGNAPPLDEKTMRSEIEFARRRGFNLMKFCLWLPPQPYLDLCDELGMLAWLEYPAWHPQFTPQYLEPLRREYDEFFHYDRRHPSVVLRSLTCETGHGADIQVVRALYERCHATVPNALVEDDSSWIEWNRVHDFYDDHPYGNNHTWPATLRRLDEYIAGRQAKPLLLGEAIAADTWYGPTRSSDPWQEAPNPPISAAGNRRWLEKITPRLAPGSLDSLASDSRHYAHLMRKYQIETFRRDVPDGGYVVSVLRDFSLAGMGLIDYFDRPKTQPEDWEWQDDLAIVLRTTDDRRSFSANSPIAGQILVSDFQPRRWSRGTLTVRITAADGSVLDEKSRDVGPWEAGRVHAAAEFSWQPPAAAHPYPVRLNATLEAEGRRWTNTWSLWVIPPVPDILAGVSHHPSWNRPQWVPPADGAGSADASSGLTQGPQVVLTRQLDAALLKQLEQGGRVVLVPNDGPGSITLRSHWFLRGGPVINQTLVDPALPRQMLVELQHFDLASSVVPELPDGDRWRPLLLLWDNHDIPEVKTHGLAFEMPVGKGWLLVSALRHDGATNSVGRWMMSHWVRRLRETPTEDSPRAVSNQAWLRGELTRRERSLVTIPWKFQPDPDHGGQKRRWHTAEFDDHDWAKIGIDRHWEAQGHPSLDGWAWYRTKVSLPADWPADACYVNFSGVDDHYRAYVNGELVGTGGDIETKQTAFELRASHSISAHVRPGTEFQLAIEVYDWYGAGGIFRPIVLSTTPLGPVPSLWKPLVEPER